MHEGNTFCYDPVLSMARSDSPMNLSLLDDAFSLQSFIQSDPNLQEVAVTTPDTPTTPTTPPSHFDSDLANLSLPSTSVKTSNFVCNPMKTNDTPFLCLINKGEVEAKIEQFSDDPVRPPATITKPLELLQESASFSPQNNNFLDQINNDKESPSEVVFNQNTCTMSLNDINDLLLDTNSKPNPKPEGNNTEPPKFLIEDDDSPVPSTSAGSSFVTKLQKTGRCSRAPTKNAIAARENRVKKKVYVEHLEKSNTLLQKENRDLTQRLESLTSEFEKRGSEIEYLKSVLVNDGKLYEIVKNVPDIKSVGFPLESSGKGPLCVGGTGMSPVKTETRCINNKNHKNISENNPLASSSFSPPSTSLHCSLQFRNVNIMKDSLIGNLDKGPQKKDPFRGSSNCQTEVGISKDLRKTLSGRVTKHENQKCFSTWGAKGKKKVTKSTDPTS